MSTPEHHLLRAGVELPPPPAPGGNYLPFRRHGDLIILAGVISATADGREWIGTIGTERNLEEGREAAHLCALNALAVLRSITGSLDDIGGILYVGGYVNAIPGYGQSPSVVNGASDLFAEIFGEAGLHARAAVTVAGLPRNATVEIQVTATLAATE